MVGLKYKYQEHVKLRIKQGKMVMGYQYARDNVLFCGRCGCFFSKDEAKDGNRHPRCGQIGRDRPREKRRI